MDLAGKTIVVSGGNGGIGSAVVKELHQKGAIVYSLDIAPKPTESLSGVNYIVADSSNATQLQEVLQLIKTPVDMAFLNTGVMRRGTIFDSTEEDFDSLFNASLKCSWMLLKYLKPRLVSKATVVQMSSAHALYTEADPGVYSLTKKAVVALAEMVAITCPDYDVKIVYPGPVLTNLLLTGRNAEDRQRISKIATKPEDFAKKVIELMESDKKTLKFVPKDFSYELS